MIQIRKSNDRGHTKIDWLDSYHTFSFGEYHNPQYMHFSDLRVINDDIVQPDRGFMPHDHRDMEIVTIILEGELEHKDSMGNGSIIKPGDVQRMSAGTGVTHSEFNPSQKQQVRLLQIWIMPQQKDMHPGYEQRYFAESDKQNKFLLVASPDGHDESITIHQDVEMYLTDLQAKKEISYITNPERVYWIQIANGSIQLNGKNLEAGDGAAIIDEKELMLRGLEKNSEILFFNLRK